MIDKYNDLSLGGYDVKAEFYSGKSVMHAAHIHSYYELYFCPENIAQRSVICGIEYNHHFPSAIISKPYTIHSMSCIDDSPTDFRRYVFYFNDELISALGIKLFPSDITKGSMGVLFKLSSSDAEYLERIIKIAYEPEHRPSAAAEGMLLSFIIYRLYAFAGQSGIVAVGSSNYYVQNATKFIAEHFAENIDTLAVARAFSVSRSKLVRDFKEASGSTPKEFIESCRLNGAKHILDTEPQLPIVDVAERVGFCAELFLPFFQKTYG